MLWTPEAILLPNEIISHMLSHAKLFQHTSLEKDARKRGAPRAEFRIGNCAAASNKNLNTLFTLEAIGWREVLHHDIESGSTSKNKITAVVQPAAETDSISCGLQCRFLQKNWKHDCKVNLDLLP